MTEAGESTSAQQENEQAALPLVLRDTQGWGAIMLLVLGRETGMLDAVVQRPATAAELAKSVASISATRRRGLRP